MAEPAADNMVLRTIHLPLEVDRQLREIAFSKSISKAKLIREFIEEGLTVFVGSGEKTSAERAEERVKKIAAQRAEKEGMKDAAETAGAKPTPAEIMASVTPDALISFIDGKPYKALKRHLSTHDLDFDTYRARYGLPADYPKVSANYSADRSVLAKALGLGQQRRKPAPKEAEAAEAVAAAPKKSVAKTGGRRKRTAA